MNSKRKRNGWEHDVEMMNIESAADGVTTPESNGNRKAFGLKSKGMTLNGGGDGRRQAGNNQTRPVGSFDRHGNPLKRDGGSSRGRESGGRGSGRQMGTMLPTSSGAVRRDRSTGAATKTATKPAAKPAPRKTFFAPEEGHAKKPARAPAGTKNKLHLAVTPGSAAATGSRASQQPRSGGAKITPGSFISKSSKGPGASSAHRGPSAIQLAREKRLQRGAGGVVEDRWGGAGDDEKGVFDEPSMRHYSRRSAQPANSYGSSAAAVAGALSAT
ncbi:unnamed protein product [Ectocarpus sp. 12 AP-2014]